MLSRLERRKQSRKLSGNKKERKRMAVIIFVLPLLTTVSVQLVYDAVRIGGGGGYEHKGVRCERQGCSEAYLMKALTDGDSQPPGDLYPPSQATPEAAAAPLFASTS